MCGIVGVASRDPSSLVAAAAMTRAIAHRGPDDEGLVAADSRTRAAWAFSGPDTVQGLDLPRFPTRLPANANLVLGHRRLAILDLTPAGHGPMSWGDGRAWLTYNGEIYNYVELKRELVSLGHSFRTQTDTEVLLASYAEWGEAALSRLNGMWAFGLYDVERQRLFYARDRFGIKPFYYHQDETLFMFASEIKALLAHPRAPRQAAHDELISFLTRGRLDEGEATFFRGIRSLPAGHCLSFDLATQRTAVRRWYDLEPSQPGHEPEEIGELLEDSIRLRLRSDVEVGTCLSGGLDSSAIVTTIAALDAGAASSHRSFSVLYDEPGLDESGFVDQVLAATGSRGERTSATSRELVEELPRLVQAQDEPIPSAGPYSQWRVMKLAHRAGIKVLLDGQGADELLAGYHYQLGPFLAELLTTRGPARALAALRRLRATTGRPSWFLAGLMGYHVVPLPDSLRRAVAARFVTHSYVPRALISPDVRHDLGAPVSRRLEPCRDLAEERRRGLTLTSLPALLRYEDRNSMAFHIEARTPFLDYRLVEAALSLDASDVLRDGWTKAPLRDAMRGRLPDSVRLRRDKLGFPTPERRWLKEIAPEIRSWLGSGSLVRSLLDEKALASWLAQPDALLAARPGLWRLVAAELWLRYVAGTL